MILTVQDIFNKFPSKFYNCKHYKYSNDKGFFQKMNNEYGLH